MGLLLMKVLKLTDVKRDDDKMKITISATHNAYLKKFGYLHKREINLFKKENLVQGIDTLLKKNDNYNDANFSIRFHIYPGIEAFQTMGGNDILLQINKK